MSTDKAQDEPRNEGLEDCVKSVVFGNQRTSYDGYMRAPEMPCDVPDEGDVVVVGNTKVYPFIVKLKKLRPDVELPAKGTDASAAFDVYAAKDMKLEAGRAIIVPLGFSIALPTGYDLKILARSSGPKRGLLVANGLGLIDEDYRDEVGVIVKYLPDNTYQVTEKLYKCLTTFVKNLTSAQQFVLDDARKRLLNAVDVKPFPPLEIKKGERIAQVQLNKVIPMKFVEVDELSETSREGGWGSTGV